MKIILSLLIIFLLTSSCGLDQGISRGYVISQSEVENVNSQQK